MMAVLTTIKTTLYRVLSEACWQGRLRGLIDLKAKTLQTEQALLTCGEDERLEGWGGGAA